MAKDMFERKQVDSDGDELFAVNDLVACVTGGPCMVILNFVGESKAECLFFTDSGVPFQKIFPLSVLEHWIEE